MRYQDVYRWSRTFEVIRNRVIIINQIHDCQYDGLVTNPCRLSYHGGTYSVSYCGTTVATWRLYDVESVERAFERVDLLATCFWDGRREGHLALFPVGRSSLSCLRA